MKRVIMLLIGAALLAAVPAQAHTNIVIAGFQIVPGGYVSGYGVAPNQTIDDGPASDGTLIFTNADPVAHRLVQCDPCGAAPKPAVRPVLDIRLEPGQRLEIVVPKGTWEYFDPAYPHMRGKVRVTSGH